MRAYSFRSLIQNAVVAAIASPLGGCDEAPPPGIENDPGFVTVSCGEPEGDVFRGLTLEPPLDYLDLRSTALPFAESTTPGVVVSSRGVVCGGAADQPLCNGAFSKALNRKTFFLDQCVQVCTTYYMLATRGDQVLVLDTPESVKGVLGLIDTPQEAMLLVEMRGLSVPCRRGGAKPISGGFEVQAFSMEGCDGSTRHLFHVSADGGVVEVDTVVEKTANPNCVVGRRPTGLTDGPSGPPEVTPLASYLSDAARLEAASIFAFRQLTRELSTHRAPRRLIAAARRAARDEVRHARVTAELARRFGAGTFQIPGVRNVGARDLEAIATENATEGCVRETFGAAVGAFQSLRAQDKTVASAMRQIAADESRHALLAWKVARWSEKKLSPAAAKRVREARSAAILELRGELHSEPDSSLVSTLGVPSAREALALHSELECTLWAPELVGLG